MPNTNPISKQDSSQTEDCGLPDCGLTDCGLTDCGLTDCGLSKGLLRRKITLLEPFFTGSHRQWAEGLQRHSGHEIELLTLQGRHWKWRMYGGAVALADKFNKSDFLPDLILASDMLDLATFLSLARKKSKDIPAAVYFHENQITYPWSPDDKDVQLGRDNQYGFINYTTALTAGAVFFNSLFHKNIFLESLPKFLRQFPDHRGLENIGHIAAKSKVLYLGMDLNKFDKYKTTAKNKAPIILWNHRWEYDKNPELFFEILFQLKKENIAFGLIVLGKAYKKTPPIFAEAKNILAENILHFGYADNFPEYAKWLWKADILPVTSNQDFFGGSIVEAVYCNCFPILPKRLAYPEHLPAEMHGQHFYENKKGFYEILKRAVIGFENARRFSGSNYVAKYDWPEMIKEYDLLLGQIKR